MKDAHYRIAQVADGLQYARDVLDGRIITGEWTQKACRRFFNDLERTDVVFREDKAQQFLTFFKYLRHVKGDLAGQQIELLPFEVFNFINLFGFYALDGTRRFRTAYLSVARKNNKTTAAAGFELYGLIADGEAGSEVYVAATSQHQSNILFNIAKGMVRKSPALAKRIDITKETLSHLPTESCFQALTADAETKDGLNAHFIVVDELHAHKTRDLWDVLETSTGARSNPLMLAITTRGTLLDGICYELDDYSQKILNGLVQDDSVFCNIYTLDKNDDVFDERNWVKANPSLGYAKKIKTMRDLALKAKSQTQAKNNFLTKHLNIWAAAAYAYFDTAAWKSGAGVLPESRPLFKLWVGLDLATKLDFAAAVKVFFDEETGHYYIDVLFWLPKARLTDADVSERQRELYKKWHDAGAFQATEGDMIDYEVIKNDLEAWVKGEPLQEIAIDPWQATHLGTLLNNEGFPVVQVPQTVKSLSEPMKHTQALIKAKKLMHTDNPLMNWMMANVVAKEDVKENVYPRKQTKNDKIDGPVALLIAMSRAIVGGGGQAAYIPDLSDDDINDYIF